MRFLISVVSEPEARLALSRNIDIIDIKNPNEGSLGASFPRIVVPIVKAKNSINPNITISATLGDLEFKPGTASWAAYGLASSGVDCIKAGLYKIKGFEQAFSMMSEISEAAKTVNGNILVAISGYADYKDIGSISYTELVRAAKNTDIDIIMLDTAIKNGRSLLDILTIPQLEEFIQMAQEEKLLVALAGSLNYFNINTLLNMKVTPNIIGVRGMICSDSNRTAGLSEIMLDEFVEKFNVFYS